MINFVGVMINFEPNFIYLMHTICFSVAYKALSCCILSCHFVIMFSVKSANSHLSHRHSTRPPSPKSVLRALE